MARITLYLSITKIKFIVKSLPIDNIPGPDSFIVKLFLKFKEKIILILYKFLKIREQETISTHFMRSVLP